MLHIMHGMSMFKVVVEYLGLLLVFGISRFQISVQMPVIHTEVLCDLPQHLKIVSGVRLHRFLYILLNSLLVDYAVI
jgi:hypothetical protein